MFTLFQDVCFLFCFRCRYNYVTYTIFLHLVSKKIARFLFENPKNRIGHSFLAGKECENFHMELRHFISLLWLLASRTSHV